MATGQKPDGFQERDAAARSLGLRVSREDESALEGEQRRSLLLFLFLLFRLFVLFVLVPIVH
jgi:hypothetical protein